MADYSAYGPLVGGDDWRAWVGVYITTNNETTFAGRVESWVWSEYGTTSGYSNIRGAAAWDNNAWSYGSATSISPNSWKKLKEVTFSVTKGHSATSKTAWAKAEGISGTYSGNSSQATVSVSVPAKKSYTVSYNANGHGTAPASQTKWHGETLQLRGAISATGFTFKGWNTKANGSGTSYAAGANYTGNAALTLYAQWQAVTYAVTYNANGGSGAPATGYKTYGANYTISTTRPTRTGFTFLGWGTSASATTASYQPGATYSTNAALALYAVWQLSYAAPTITGLNAKRCDSQGADDDEGTYVLLSFHWEVDPSDGGEADTITVRTRPKGGNWSTGTISAGGTTSGDVLAVLGDGTTFATSTAYDIQVEVTDLRGMKATATTYVSPSYFTLELLAGGTGIAMGKAATRDGLDVAMPAYFSGGNVQVEGTDPAPVILCKNLTHYGKIGADVPSGNDVYARPVRAYDASNNTLLYSEVVKTSADDLYASWALQRLNASNTSIVNGLYLHIGANGARSVTVSDAAPWRTMLDHEDTNWAYLVGSASGSRVRYRKKAGVVFVEVWYETGAAVGTTAKTLGTLPAGFRPSLQVETCAFGNANNLAMLRVNPGGSIVGKSMSGTMNYFKGVISFPV